MGEYEPKIEVHFPPVLEVPQGSTASLECFALGNPVPTITWRKLNGNLPSRARLRKSRAWLEVLNTQSSDTGTYECRVENTRGGNVVRGFLQVYARPYWTQTINDTRLDSGQELRWECRAAGRPRPSYRWLMDGKPLTSQSRVTVKNTLFTITRVNQSDSGMYQCIAENQYGAVFASAELQVLASAPSFDMYPVAKETLVCVGRDLCLECRPRSSPKASISWSKGERPLVGARVNISQEGTLRISNITHSDSGTYTCRAENIFGASSSSGIVYVKEATEVHLVPSKLDVTAGESALLTCRVTHDPTLQVHVLWSFDGRDLDFQREGGHFESVRAVSIVGWWRLPGTRWETVDTERRLTQSPSADLMIRNIQLVHTGRYSCRAWTAVDASSGTAELLVRDVGTPSPDHQEPTQWGTARWVLCSGWERSEDALGSGVIDVKARAALRTIEPLSSSTHFTSCHRKWGFKLLCDI
ncbi:contactin-5-like, partial [Heterodontus francisci]|uniref:contactin-5-like n=1 Tax=Heterodontus francisci TaxID=7792 RepID=UPI00355BC33B